MKLYFQVFNLAAIHINSETISNFIKFRNKYDNVFGKLSHVKKIKNTFYKNKYTLVFPQYLMVWLLDS